MTPLTQDPRLVVLQNPDTLAITATATNVSDDIKVTVTHDPAEFEELAKGNPFITKS